MEEYIVFCHMSANLWSGTQEAEEDGLLNR